MKLVLNNEEIIQAVSDYVSQNGIDLTNKTIEVVTTSDGLEVTFTQTKKKKKEVKHEEIKEEVIEETSLDEEEPEEKPVKNSIFG